MGWSVSNMTIPSSSYNSNVIYKYICLSLFIYFHDNKCHPFSVLIQEIFNWIKHEQQLDNVPSYAFGSNMASYQLTAVMDGRALEWFSH